MNRIKDIFSSLFFTTSSNNSNYENATIEALVINSSMINGQFVEPSSPIQIQPTSDLTLKLDSFWLDFKENYDAYNGLKPNVLVVINDDQKYRIELREPESAIRINNSTLAPIDEASPFSTFKKGAKAWVIVGAERTDNEEYVINPMWFGMLEVKP